MPARLQLHLSRPGLHPLQIHPTTRDSTAISPPCRHLRNHHPFASIRNLSDSVRFTPHQYYPLLKRRRTASPVHLQLSSKQQDCIVASSVRPRFVVSYLQTAIEELENWFRTWQIEVNTVASTVIWLTKRRHHSEGDVTIFGGPIHFRR